MQMTPIKVVEWGAVDGRIVHKYTLTDVANQEVDVITYGATITSIRVLDKHGKIADVVLGYDSIEGYLSSENPYFGATIGRVANRVGNAEFTLNGKKYRLAKNQGKDSLHGGYKGWSSKIWNANIDGNRLVMSLLSEDNDEGYPGDAIASVTFSFNEKGKLVIEMKVFVSQATPINLTNHSYFNLAGHDGNATEIYTHRITLNADRWTVTDAGSIPTGELRSVANTLMDLRQPTCLGDVINKVSVLTGGYDHNFCLPNLPSGSATEFVAKVEHSASGRYLEVYSNQPGVQFYTANFLPDATSPIPGIRGKAGKEYFKHGAFCLETQNYPDAINHPNFPDSVIKPGQLYEHVVIYKFTTQA